jgi:hypothetical protein
MVAVAKADKAARVARNEGRLARRLVPAANSVHASDDEDEDYEADTSAKIQALFEPTKR